MKRPVRNAAIGAACIGAACLPAGGALQLAIAEPGAWAEIFVLEGDLSLADIDVDLLDFRLATASHGGRRHAIQPAVLVRYDQSPARIDALSPALFENQACVRELEEFFPAAHEAAVAGHRIRWRNGEAVKEA